MRRAYARLAIEILNGSANRRMKDFEAPAVVQQAAQAALDLSHASEAAGFWTDELISQSVRIALAVIMNNEVLKRFPQRPFILDPLSSIIRSVNRQ